MAGSEEYWKRRRVREAYDVFSEAEAEADEIAKLYKKAALYMDRQIKGIFDRFKKKYGLSEEEAKRILEKASDRGSVRSVEKALKNVEQTAAVSGLREELESAAFASRIARIAGLEKSIDRMMTDVYKQELSRNTDFYKSLAEKAYLRDIFDLQQRSGVAFSFSDVNPKLIDRLLRSRWSGKNYSSRIWGNTQRTAQKVKEEVIIGALTGKTEREMAQVLTEEFGSSAKQSRRLIRTESNYILTQADMAARKEADIEEYMYLATLDIKTCQDTCAKLDGRIFAVKDQKPGVNCPPMHPWCRCTTISVINRKWLERMKRRARDPVTGKTFTVPMSMTYQEWYDKYVSGKL